MALAISCCAQSPKSITYLRLGQQLVEQRSQLPAPSEEWSDALRKLYAKAGIPTYQIVEQTVPGSSQKLLICTIAGRGDSVIVVSASLARPKDEDAATVAWASRAMLPLLAESLNAAVAYPSLTPEQLQGLKVGRFQKLSVATCVGPSSEAKSPTYWIVALAYE
jgi:hypothetical protein